MNPKIAVVTGANKGIGFEIAKQLADNGIHVIATARNESLGESSVQKITNGSVEYHQLDITDEKSVDGLADYLKTKYHGFDILVNNAGIAFKGDAFDENVARTTIGTNYFGTKRACLKLIPLIRDGGRVVNVSSSVGRPSLLSSHLKQQFTKKDLTMDELDSLMNTFIRDVAKGNWKEEGWPSTTYGVSKIGETALTRVLSKSYPSILINACCPGFIRTDMSSNNPAGGPPSEGAKVPVWLATLPSDSKYNGGFFKNMAEVEWENM